MAIVNFLLGAIPSIAKAGYLLLNPPKQSDYENKYMEDALNKVIANNSSDIVEKTLLNQMTSGAKSLGSRMYQNAQHDIDVMGNRGLLSEGQQANALLQTATGIQGKIGEQYDNALLQQTQQNNQLRNKIDEASLKLGELKDQARQQFLQAKNQQKAGLWETGMDLATTGMNMFKQKADKNWFSNNIIKKYGSDTSKWSYDNMMGVMLQMMMHDKGWM